VSPSPERAPRRAAATLEVRAGALATLAPPDAPGGVFVVTDANVAPLLPAALAALPRHVLTPGEEHKTWDELGRLLAALDAAGLDRDGHVLAVGGGVVTDIAGLAASLHRRGVAWTAVPTTLVGQVDAAIGGKTAINHRRAKNVVGAFHQPRLVICDTATLATLPERDYRSGLAEVVKHGIVLDADYFGDVESSAAALRERDPAHLSRVIAGSCRIKAGVVERDEQEAELRAVLNYGHTVGHALEAATAYERWTHGEAVSLGIAAASRLAERLGVAETRVRERQVRLLDAFGLPTSGAGVPGPTLLEAMGRDKKARDGRLPFVLAPAIGKFRLVFDVPAAEVLATLAEIA